ncbi:MAG: septum formation initiator family protein [Bacteroidota bacterium]
MPPSRPAFLRAPRLRRRLLLTGAAALLVWVAFFDSHSLLRRADYMLEQRALRADNAALVADIERLEAELGASLSDTTIERLAREEYGMRRPGETVYRLAPAD